MNTLKGFADACRTLNSDGIYILFEDVISEQLRDEIYKLDGNTFEPARNSLNKLGYMFGVKSLIEY
jgi:hypothetical protein